MMDYITTITSTNYYLGTCEKCDRPYRVEIENRTGQYQYVACPGCGGNLAVERLAAVTTEEVCDARCMGATGPSCSCACGGANHGSAWGKTATTYELESAIKALRDRQERTERRRQQRAATKQARKEQVFAQWLADGNQDVVKYLKKIELDAYGFLAAMVELIVDQEPLSERQADAVRRNMERDAQREARQAAYEASKTAAPLGKGITVEGTIISAKSQDGYAYGTYEYKITIQCDGYRVYGTLPSALKGPVLRAGWLEDLKGQRVRFVAELVPSKGNDPSFVIFKRPTKAEKI